MQDPERHLMDAGHLEQALEAEADPVLRARYIFELARRYREAGDKEKALEMFLQRAALGGDADETFRSLLAAGRLQAALGRPFDEVMATFRRACDAQPARLEAWHAASRYCRLGDRFAEGYDLAKRGLDIASPAAGPGVEQWIYDFGLLDELAVNAYWTGRYKACADACRRLLDGDKMPPAMRGRVTGNLAAALDRLREIYPVSDWVPERAQGGTELMIDGLRTRLGDELDGVDLKINMFDPASLTGKPLIVWFHHDVDQGAVQWCRDESLTPRVNTFVFVSYWQRQRYLDAFGLPPERCIVLRNATETEPAVRPWGPDKTRRIAYTSTPFRGLSVLLDAWERLRPEDAELHIWSSWKLYRMPDDQSSRQLFDRARSLPNVFYRGLLPNDQLRNELRTIDYLAYPCIFAETSCLSVVEAMEAGCRVICSALGALPETTAGFARIYPWQPDRAAHAAAFAEVLADELRNPWAGRVELSSAQQNYCRMFYDWSVRVEEWRGLLGRVAED